MSTILKALKKAEEGRPKDSLPERILQDESPAGTGKAQTALRLAGALLLPAAAAAVLLFHYRAAMTGAGGPPAAPSPRPAKRAALASPTPSPAPPPSPAPTAPERPVLRLSGVIWDERKPFAIVNGKTISKGDRIEGARLMAITPEGAVFRYGGEEFTLKVK